MAQAQLNSNVFQQVTSKDGETKFRQKFGRQKALIFRRHDATSLFYLDIYDNKNNRYMCLGMDELDFIVNIRSSLDIRKPHFPQQFPQMRGVVVEQHHPSPPAGHGSGYTFQTNMPPPTRRPAAGGRDVFGPEIEKKPRYEPTIENISPPEEVIPVEIMEDFYNA